MLNKYPLLQLTAGLDEVGRGALVGDVVVAAVILREDQYIYGLQDSKKISNKKRIMLSKQIKKKLDWSIGSANSREIDLLNVSQATLLAMERAINNLKIKPNFIFIDGNIKLNSSILSMSVINGDQLIPAVSAASIIAKVYRDEKMIKLHKFFPVYNFDQNKGYPTSHHLNMLDKYGVTSLHRHSFAPVSRVLTNNVFNF